MGENPMLSDPDSNHVEEALNNLELLIVQDIFLSETAQLADVVLPAASFAETEGTFTNTERRVQRVHKALDPPGEARGDWQIVCDLAHRMGYEMSYPDVAAIQDEIAQLTPIYGGITYDRLQEGSLQWPCPDRHHPGTPILHVGEFTRGLGKFHSVEFIPPQELPDEQYPFVLSTGRILQHFHTGTITMSRRSDVLDELVSVGVIEIHPDDAEALGIVDGQLVRVSSRRGQIEIGAHVTERVMPGTVFLAFHYREAPAKGLTMTETTFTKERIAGAILAGGQALRYGGKAKGLLKAPSGLSIIQHEIRQLNLAGIDEIIIVASDPKPWHDCACNVVIDLRSGIGPLAGIEAALAHYGNSYEATLFLPCDLPAITSTEISQLQAAFTSNSAPVAVAITSDLFWEPLCTIVHNGLLKTVSQAIEDGERRPQRLWRNAGAIEVRFEDATPFFNVNTPQDMARWRASREQAS